MTDQDLERMKKDVSHKISLSIEDAEELIAALEASEAEKADLKKDVTTLKSVIERLESELKSLKFDFMSNKNI